MNLVVAALRRAANDLGRYSKPWALVGGFAVSARAEPRFTRDVDIAVSVGSDQEAEAVVRALLADGYGLLASVEHESGRLATIRLTVPGAPDQNVVVTLLFASSGVEQEIAQAAEVIESLPGLSVPVAAVGDILAIKLLARDDQRRPQDLADLRALLSGATPGDLKPARDMVQKRRLGSDPSSGGS